MVGKKKLSNFFSAVNFCQYLVIKRWIRIGSGSGSVFTLKCRIRNQGIRIRTLASWVLALVFCNRKKVLTLSQVWMWRSTATLQQFLSAACTLFAIYHGNMVTPTVLVSLPNLIFLFPNWQQMLENFYQSILKQFNKQYRRFDRFSWLSIPLR